MSEREIRPCKALSNIKSIIHTLGFNAVTQYADHNKWVATAELFDKDGSLIESGAGKGPHSLIGALAESVEHFSTFRPDPLNRTFERCEVISNQKEASQDGILTSMPHTYELIECLKLTTSDNLSSIIIPSLLTCQNTENNNHKSASTQFLARYSSNSGIAFGCTEAEALLHGTLEVIERHILSLFFMAVCDIEANIELYTPSNALLAQALENNKSALEAAKTLQIIVIKDIFSVYFSVAIPKAGPGDHHLSPIGSGASLDICTAVQRAVTEQLQADILYNATDESTDRNALEFLSRSGSLKALIDFNSVKDLQLPKLDYPLQVSLLSVPQQLDLLKVKLSINNKKLFQRTVAEYSTAGIVTQTYIPGLERFNIIRNGCIVAPQHILRGV
jgi:ribosomal protein S12 methylthiotransferase accessory factor